MCVAIAMSRKVTGILLTSEEKHLTSKRKVQIDHSEEIHVVAAWFNQQTWKEIHQSVVVKAVSTGFHELELETPEDKNTQKVVMIHFYYCA